MRRLLVIAVALALLAAACDSGSEPPPSGLGATTTRPPPEPPPSPEEVQEVDRCEDLTEVGVLFVENMIQALERGLSIEVLTGEAPAPPDIELLRDVGREMDRRVERLGCDAEQINREIVASVADIQSADEVVSLFLDIVRAGILGSSESPSTSPSEAP